MGYFLNLKKDFYKGFSILKEKFDKNHYIKLGITGLSHSGKTTFITSLVNYLKTSGDYQCVILEKVPEGINRFQYEKNIENFYKEPALWPESTVKEAEIILKVIKDSKEYILDIVDYPGEWLLDLPMLKKNYEDWSNSVKDYVKKIDDNFDLDWIKKAEKLSKSNVEDDIDMKISDIVESYTQWLKDLKMRGFSYLQPGRFLLPDSNGDFASFASFVPWVWTTFDNLSENDQKLLEKFKLRYQNYVNSKVVPFYKNFKNITKQYILVDCLSTLCDGYNALKDLRFTLGEISKNFSYGEQSFFKKYFKNELNIESVMFLATKIEKVTKDDGNSEKEIIRLLKFICDNVSSEISEKSDCLKNIKFSLVSAVDAVGKLDSEKEKGFNYIFDKKHAVPLPKLLEQEINRFSKDVHKEHLKEIEINPPSVEIEKTLPNIHMQKVCNFIFMKEK